MYSDNSTENILDRADYPALDAAAENPARAPAVARIRTVPAAIRVVPSIDVDIDANPALKSPGLAVENPDPENASNPAARGLDRSRPESPFPTLFPASRPLLLGFQSSSGTSSLSGEIVEGMEQPNVLGSMTKNLGYAVAAKQKPAPQGTDSPSENQVGFKGSRIG